MRRLRKIELLEGIEDIQFSRIVAHNTVKYKKSDDNRIYIRFYDTDIIIFYSHYITINSGGYNTVTTKNRINEFQNVCHIQQIDSQWFVSTPVTKAINFYEGMKISNEGRHIRV
jgi:hypothetical protein